MGSSMNTAKRVEALLSGTAEEMGFEIVDVEFVKEGQNYYLRVYLDKQGGITIDDCEIFSKAAEKLLDDSDPRLIYLRLALRELTGHLKKTPISRNMPERLLI